MTENGDGISQFGDNPLVVWADSEQSTRLTGEKAEEFESIVREREGVVQAFPRMWSAPSFLAVLAARIGKPEARRVLAYVTAWVAASQAAGHPATVVEYAAHWGLGEATGYRELRSFKAAFPSESTPERLAWVLGWVRTPWITEEEYGQAVTDLLGSQHLRSTDQR